MYSVSGLLLLACLVDLIMLFTDMAISLSRILIVKDKIIAVPGSPKAAVVLICAPVELRLMMVNGMDFSETDAGILHLIRRDFRTT